MRNAAVTASLPMPASTVVVALRSIVASLVKREIRLPVGLAWK